MTAVRELATRARPYWHLASCLPTGELNANGHPKDNGLIVLSAATLSPFLGQRPSWLRVQRHVMGSVLAALAPRLLTDRVRPATP